MNRRSGFKYPILQMICIFALALGAAAFAAQEGSMAVGTIREWPVKLQAAGSKAGASGWSYSVKIEITNTLDRVLKLDEPSVAYGGKPGAPGSLSNNLFEVTADGKPIAYHGMMKKRAPPDEFIELKPGAKYEVVVDLGREYPLAKGAHDVVVRFEHRNHFSPDPFVMQSAPLKFQLK
jgi:hypothetical protein